MSRIRDGATSDLIRRFENLALSKSGEAAAETKSEAAEKAPPMLTKRTPVVVGTPTMANRLSSFPALENTPPLAPTNPKAGNSTQTPQSDRLAATGGLSVSPMASSSLPALRQRSSSQLEELAGIITSSYKKSGSVPRRKSLVTSLNQRAAISATVHAPAKSWLRTAERYMDEGRVAKQSGDSETAYLKYMLASNILREKLPKLRDFDQVSRSTTLARLKQQFATQVLDDLEALAEELRQRPYVEVSSFASEDGLPQSLGVVDERVNADEDAADADGRWLAAEKSRVEEIDAQARMLGLSASSAGVSAAPALSSRLASIAETTDSTGDLVDAHATTCTPSELQSLLDRYELAGRPTVLLLDVRPHQEYVWGRIDHKYTVNVDPLGLKKHCTSKDIESSLVLTSDEQQGWFRMRAQFDLVVYVTQSAGSFGDTRSSEVAAVEYLNSAIYHYEYEHTLRHPPLFLLGGFDAWAKEMSNRRCVWSDEARRTLARSPRPKSMMVQWDSAKDAGGDGGLDLASMLAYHAPTAGITGGTLAPYNVRYQAAPVSPVPPVPAMPAALQTEGLANEQVITPVSGSVFDFFQQNSTYRPQWPQQQQQEQQQEQQQSQQLQEQPPSTDARHRPTHTSFTQGYGAIGSPAPVTVPAAEEEDFEGNLPADPPSRGGELARRKTIFDNPTYGFTGPAYSNGARAEASVDSATELAEQKPAYLRRRRQPPPIPNMRLPSKPAEYSAAEAQAASDAVVPQSETAVQQTEAPVHQQPPPKPQEYVPAQQQQQQPQWQPQLQQQQQNYSPQQQQHGYTQSPAPYQYQQYGHMQPGYASSHGLYSHPVAAGSDPSLNGRMHSGANLRNSITYAPPQQPTQYHSPAPHQHYSPQPQLQQYQQPAPKKPRKPSALDSASYGATGLKNFGNTCFMNSVIQCLVGTAPFARYFLQGGWKKDLVRDTANAGQCEVAGEFARLVDSMWRGQYGSISPIAFRQAVGGCSQQFGANDQEDAHEFASFLLDTLHEALNRVHPRPPPYRDMTPEEERMFEQQSSLAQAEEMWRRYTRRNWSIMTSIFQGQVQSRLACLSCGATSTTYHTFTELSVPIPTDAAAGGKPGLFLRRSAGRSAAPVSLYQCLSAFSETETLDGDNRWLCPRCKVKRKATKRLLVSHLPLVLIVHLKRFSTVGHFREKLETNVVFPTQLLQMDPYVISDL
ncbi:ubiquitin-specific protease doa4, partial [Coemansia sp. RSA 2703]